MVEHQRERKREPERRNTEEETCAKRDRAKKEGREARQKRNPDGEEEGGMRRTQKGGWE